VNGFARQPDLASVATALHSNSILPVFLQYFANHGKNIIAMLDEFIGFVVSERFASTEAMDGFQETGFAATVIANDKIEALLGFNFDLVEISESIDL
jgi:hypothetical protein